MGWVESRFLAHRRIFTPVYCDSMVRTKRLPDIAETGYEFLKAEIHTGFTLAAIALDSEHEEKKERNRKNARVAYDTVVKTRGKVLLAPEQSKEISSQL